MDKYLIIGYYKLKYHGVITNNNGNIMVSKGNYPNEKPFSGEWVIVIYLDVTWILQGRAPHDQFGISPVRNVWVTNLRNDWGFRDVGKLFYFMGVVQNPPVGMLRW